MRRQGLHPRYRAAFGALVVLVALGAATAVHVYEPATAPSPLMTLDEALAPTQDAVTLDVSEPPVSAPSMWTTAVAFANDHLPQFVLLWLAGVMLLSVRLTFGWMRAHRMATNDATEATAEWQRVARRLSEALGIRGAIRLLESAAVEVPTVIGWLRPVVLLPVATLSGLSTEQMEMVLAHELAHVRRHDFFVNLMQAVIETLLFYHPAVWWISGRMRVEREHCCDDVAVGVCGNPLLYARALTRLEELRIDPAQAVVAANGGSLLDRIRRLAGARAEAPNAPARWAAGAALLVVVAALIIAPSIPLRADSQTPQVPNAPPPVAATPSPEKAKAAKCNIDVVAEAVKDADVEMDAESDSDSDSDGDVEVNIDTDAIAAAAVAPAVRAAVGPAVRSAIAVAPRAMATVAPAIAANVWGVETPEPPQAVPATPAPTPARVWHVREHKKIGASGKLTVDDLIALRTAGVTPAYIDEMRGAGLGELSLDEIAAMKMQGLSAQYLTELRKAGLKIDSVETAISLRIQGVTPQYVSEMRNAGYPNLSARELIELRVMGVNPSYVKQLADAGYRNLSARDLTSLRAMGVTPDFIKSLSDAGYTNLSVKDLTRMAAVGVNADFIRDLAKYRTK